MKTLTGLFLVLCVVSGCTLNEPPYTINAEGDRVYRSSKSAKKKAAKKKEPELMELPGVETLAGQEVEMFLVYFVPPNYPMDAKAEGIEGDVQVEFKIKSDGSTKDVKIVYTDHPGIFEYTVLDVVRRWKFVPKKYPETYRLTLAFEL